MKPYYSEKGIEIWLGDCREVLPSLRNYGDWLIGKWQGIGLIITDPPYGIDFDTDYRRFTTGFSVERKEYAAVHGDDEPFDPRWLLAWGKKQVIWGANCFSDKLPRGSWLVWDKRFKNGESFLADAEAAWLSSGHGIYLYSVTQQGCIRPEAIDHPTQKPVAVMEWCIARANQDGLICDPYMGSGSTLEAAKLAGRKAIGIEIHEPYAEIAARRLQQEVLDFSG